MTTTNDLLDATLRHIYGTSTREQHNRLTSTVDADDTSFVFDFALGPIVTGAVLAIDLELVYVWDVNTTARTATVQRGWLGSTGAAHTAATFVTVNPRYSRFGIFQELNNELDDLSTPQNGLYNLTGLNRTYNPAVNGYDLTGLDSGDIEDIFEVRFDLTGPEERWPTIPRSSWTLKRGQDSTDQASSMVLVLNRPAEAGQRVRVVYKAPFAHLATATDNVQTVTGLPATANDIPPLGAALRIAAPREIKRNFDENQGDTRRAGEVPPGAALRSPALVADLRMRRIRSERQRLERKNRARHY